MAAKITINNFILYGLNRNRNFLSAPICDCGCEEKMCIQLEDQNEVDEFCMEMLSEHRCSESMIFCVYYDGTMRAVITSDYDEDEDEMLFAVVTAKDRDMHFFADLDGDLRPCCYGLICEILPGQWKIME